MSWPTRRARAFSRGCEHVFTGERQEISRVSVPVLQCILCAAVVVPLREVYRLIETLAHDS